MANKGLYANIHAKRKRGGKMRKKGAKGAPTAANFKRAKHFGLNIKQKRFKLENKDFDNRLTLYLVLIKHFLRQKFRLRKWSKQRKTQRQRLFLATTRC